MSAAAERASVSPRGARVGISPTIAMAVAALRWAVADRDPQPTPDRPLLSPRELTVLFKAAAGLAGETGTSAARRFGVSSNHLTLVLEGHRRGSLGLAVAIADYIGVPVEAFQSWMTRPATYPARRRRFEVTTPLGPIALLAPVDARLKELRAACDDLLSRIAAAGGTDSRGIGRWPRSRSRR